MCRGDVRARDDAVALRELAAMERRRKRRGDPVNTAISRGLRWVPQWSRGVNAAETEPIVDYGERPMLPQWSRGVDAAETGEGRPGSELA
jgi:hypothetical protein